jgi:hypothetical protein
MMVVGKSLSELPGMHHQKGNAIGQRPVFSEYGVFGVP